MYKPKQRIGRHGIKANGCWYWHYELLAYIGCRVTIAHDDSLIQISHEGKIIHVGQLH